MLSCLFKFLILPFLFGKHALSYVGIFNILVHCLIHIFQHLDGLLNDLVFKVIVAVVFPHPVSAQLLNLQLPSGLLHFLHLFHLRHLGLKLRILSHSEGVFRSTGISVKDAVLLFGFFQTKLSGSQQLQVFCLFFPDLDLLVFVKPHPLDCFEGNEPRNCDFHGVVISFGEIPLCHFVGLGNAFQDICHEIYLISQQIVPKETLDDEIPIDQVHQVIHKALVVLQGNFPEVHPRGEKRAQPLLHGVEGFAVGNQVKLLDFGEVGVGQFFKDVSWLYIEFDGSVVVGAEDV